MFSMFHEKDDQGHSTGDWSMTRVVIWMFALTCCATLLTFAYRNTNPAWPFISLCGLVVMALPLIYLFDSVASWFSTAPGKALIAKLVDTLPAKIAGTSITTVTHEEKTTHDSSGD